MSNIISLVNGEVVLTDAAYAVKEFKQLIRRDRGGYMEGDANGTKKLRAIAELGLIWYCCNSNSPGIKQGLEGSELEKRGVEFFGLPSNWAADEEYTNAFNVYAETYASSGVAKAIRSVSKGLKLSMSMTNSLISQLEKISSNKDLSIEDIASYLKINKELMNVTSELPSTIEKLKDLEKLYLLEERKAKIGRGGVVITSSMQFD
jgi:hypothetical protein